MMTVKEMKAVRFVSPALFVRRIKRDSGSVSARLK
jgi:hypothetical protein